MIKSREDRKRFEATLTTGLKELGLDQLKVVWLAEEPDRLARASTSWSWLALILIATRG